MMETVLHYAQSLADPRMAFTWVVRLSAVGILLVSLETLFRRRVLAEDGLVSWEVGSLRRPYLVRGAVGRFLDAVLKYPNVCVLLGTRALLAIFLVAGPERLVSSPWFVVPMAAMLMLFTVRHPYGQDGSDQMALIIFAGAALASMAGGRWSQLAFLWFIALQVCLSYGTAGIAKATARGWRDGTFLAAVAGTHLYGLPRMGVFLRRHGRLARVLSNGIVIWESAFPLVLVLPLPWAYAFVAMGVLFHLSNALMMGLNNFFWMFIATYPALLYCLQHRAW